MKTPSPGCAATPTQPSPQPCSTCASARQRSATAVAEQHHRFRTARPHPRRGRRHIPGGEVVETVRVVVQVPRREAEHREAGRREQRTRVVDREVAPRMREDHRGAPRLPRGWRPPQPAHECGVLGDDPHRLALHRDTGVVVRERPEAEPERSLRTQEDVGHDAPPTRSCGGGAFGCRASVRSPPGASLPHDGAEPERRGPSRVGDRSRERHGARDRRAVRRRRCARRGHRSQRRESAR